MIEFSASGSDQLLIALAALTLGLGIVVAIVVAIVLRGGQSGTTVIINSGNGNQEVSPSTKLAPAIKVIP